MKKQSKADCTERHKSEEGSDTINHKPEKTLLCCSSISWNGLETHKVETDDGYILSMFRVTGDSQSSGESKRIPVLLIPGLFNGGKEWILHEDKDKTLPKMLLDAGFDCWMGCVRGTPHSKEHSHLKKNSKKFWDFSLDEMGKYDLPAFIDYILKISGSQGLFYIGFSMGGATIMATLNTRPEYASKIHAIIALAPGVYGYDFRTIANKVFIPLGAKVLPVTRFLYRRPVGTKSATAMVKSLVPGCIGINRESVAGGFLKLVGRVSGPIIPGSRTDKETLDRMATLIPASTSIKHVGHICQIFSSKKFRAFSYGRKGNLEHYQDPKPPTYSLRNVLVPVATFTAKDDRLVPESCVKKVADELPNLIAHHVITSPKFSHCDFLFGKDANVLLYPKIIQVLKNFGPTDYLNVNLPISFNSCDINESVNNDSTNL